MTPQRVINALKIAEEIPDLEARYQHIEDNIHMHEPRILKLIKQKVSLGNDLNSMLEELQGFREYVESARECTDNELKSMQENIDKLKQEEQRLTRSIQRLNNEELEILRLVEGQRRSKQQQEQSIQELQPQLTHQSVFIALAQEAQRALANDELRTQCP